MLRGRSVGSVVGTIGVLVIVLAVPLPSAGQMNGIVSGTVTGPDGEPVVGATITLIFEGGVSRQYETTSLENGSFAQIGLAPGPYRIMAEKPGIGVNLAQIRIRPGQRLRVDLVLSPQEELGLSDEQKASRTAFSAGVEASNAGSLDEALAKFEEALAGDPSCVDCRFNLGVVLARKEEYDQAESAFKKVLQMDATYAKAYEGLAGVYNALRKFDAAAEASAQAATLRAGDTAAHGDPSAVFDQGLILWNAGKIAEARELFEQTLDLDPSHAESHYWLGMANVNEGRLPEAATEFETYLKVDPSGRFVDQAKAMMAQIRP